MPIASAVARSRGHSSGIDSFMRRVGEVPLLNAREEVELAHRIAAGDLSAREHMIRANMRLVVSIARKYLGRGVELGELIEEGMIGLCRAADGFDPSMDIRFSTYATPCIKQSIMDLFHSRFRAIRVPAYLMKILMAIDLDLVDPKTLPRQTRRLVSRARRVLSMKIGPIDDAAGVAGPQTGEGAAGSIEADEKRQALASLMGGLNDRERSVLVLRFGLDGHGERVLKDIGREIGTTGEWVRRIQGVALNKLAKAAVAIGLTWEDVA